MRIRLLAALCAGIALAFGAAADASESQGPLKPTVRKAVAFAATEPLRDMRPLDPGRPFAYDVEERGEAASDNGHRRDGALQSDPLAHSTPAPLFTFLGPGNVDNRSIFGFRVNPPDPVGDVGLDHYVAMVNLMFAIYSKSGDLLYGPADTGTLWQDFPIEDCTDPSGDPIVFYDETSNRWVLTQFTTRFETNQFYNCVAVSQTPDPLGAYYLYAFPTGANFPDYPKYGAWSDGWYITTREFSSDNSESIGIYALDKRSMLGGFPTPRVVSFNLASPAYLVGDGLLPADLDGKRLPPSGSPQYFMGTMDDGHPDGAPFDGINLFQLRVNWGRPDQATFRLTHQLPIAGFDTLYPCFPTSRDCISQPGITRPEQKLDILSYRQRPTMRLQYRNFGTHESLVTSQSVEARPGIAGMRWWEIRSPQSPVVHQDSTYAPDDGLNRWMGSAAKDKAGNLAVGYSVSSATVFPGVRYAARLADDPLNALRAEAVLQDGGGSQLTTNSRWGDYTSLNVDPVDDCTFYYINEFYPVTELVNWQTVVGAFRLPGCS